MTEKGRPIKLGGICEQRANSLPGITLSPTFYCPVAFLKLGRNKALVAKNFPLCATKH